MFYQTPPASPNLYLSDAALALEIARRVPAHLQDEVKRRCTALGDATANTLPALAAAAEAAPPVHVPYAPWGRRIDEIRTSPAWRALQDFAASHSVVATGYRSDLGESRRLVQSIIMYLFSGSSATFLCPLAMTDGAAKVLEELAPKNLKERLFPFLTSANPQTCITSGQWMTERTGGSDVSNTETIAVRSIHQPDINVEGEKYHLSGVKWFTSSTTSEMALTLARIQEADGTTDPHLSLFCVEVKRDAFGGLVNIQVNRLKDKLGTKALPTAELTLLGVEATLLGKRGRGVAQIAAMLNITRFYNTAASASNMARATAMAEEYATKRTAFGKSISLQPLHARVLTEMRASTAGALALTLEVASLLGKVETKTASAHEQQVLRALIPIAKLTTGKQAVNITSEALECFGGAGYVEDTGIPVLLREAQVFPIWEGTTNILSLDTLRAEAKGGSLSVLLDDLHNRLHNVAAWWETKTTGSSNYVDSSDSSDSLGSLRTTHTQFTHTILRLSALSTKLKDALPHVLRDESQARRLALTTGYVLECLYLAEAARFLDDDSLVQAPAQVNAPQPVPEHLADALTRCVACADRHLWYHENW